MGLRPNLKPLAFASARPRAVRWKMRRRSSLAATPRMPKTISAKSDVVATYGSASERIPPPARCINLRDGRPAEVMIPRMQEIWVYGCQPGPVGLAGEGFTDPRIGIPPPDEALCG